MSAGACHASEAWPGAVEVTAKPVGASGGPTGVVLRLLDDIDAPASLVATTDTE